MAEIDEFAKLLFDEAKVYFDKGKRAETEESKAAYFHASILLAFCSLEAHINSIADDFLTAPELTLLDESILREKDIELKDGKYQLTGKLKFFRLEDRIEYLSKRFSITPIDKDAPYWTNLKPAMRLRNGLTHPREVPIIDEHSTEQALSAILGLLNALYKNLFKKSYPGFNRGIETTMDF